MGRERFLPNSQGQERMRHRIVRVGRLAGTGRILVGVDEDVI